MTITLAGIQFEHHDYDVRGDTLFLSVAPPSGKPPAHAHETPEGHVIEYDEAGAITAIELLNARWRLERDGEVRVTPPEHPAVADERELEAAFA